MEFEFDDEVHHSKRTHTLHRVHKKCPAHAALTDKELWDALHDENPRKNRALHELVTVVPHLFYSAARASRINRDRLVALAAGITTLLPEEQEFYAGLSDFAVAKSLSDAGHPVAVEGQPLPGVSVAYAFTPHQSGGQRRLELTIDGLQAEHRAAAAAHLDKQFGGSVTLK